MHGVSGLGSVPAMSIKSSETVRVHVLSSCEL
jgi:hypothetical protein